MDNIENNPEIISPQFFGTSQVLRWDADALLSAIDPGPLFKECSQTGCGWTSEDDFVKEFDRLKLEIIADNLVDAAGLYGVFPVITEDTKVVVLDPGDYHTTLAEFVFPRTGSGEKGSIADFFRQDGDVLAVQAVTLGKLIGDRCRQYREKAGDKGPWKLLDVIADTMQERIENKTTVEIRRAFFISRDRGRRYGFGQPGFPGIEEQSALLSIIGAEERLGVTITPDFHLYPKNSSAGFFVHHSDSI